MFFWEATIEERSQGYIYDSVTDMYCCLLCDEVFEDGVIFPRGEKLYEAKKAVVHHIQTEHESVFDYLIQLDKKYTGLSELQNELVRDFQLGLSDKEIVEKQKGRNTSTIRNHRFKLKEKEKQAKVFLSIMYLLNKQLTQTKEEQFVSFHKGAKMVDERYAITELEKKKVLETYFKEGLDGKLETFPSKEKRMIIISQKIIGHFSHSKKYTESEVNDVLKAIYDDYVTIRRYLIQYGFMERNKYGSEYWVKKRGEVDC